MIKKMMHILMLSCKKATELIEKQNYFGLNSVEKIQLRMHTSMCNACSNYQKQSQKIDTYLEKNIQSDFPPKSPARQDIDTSGLKEKIIENLKKEK